MHKTAALYNKKNQNYLDQQYIEMVEIYAGYIRDTCFVSPESYHQHQHMSDAHFLPNTVI